MGKGKRASQKSHHHHHHHHQSATTNQSTSSSSSQNETTLTIPGTPPHHHGQATTTTESTTTAVSPVTSSTSTTSLLLPASVTTVAAAAVAAVTGGTTTATAGTVAATEATTSGTVSNNNNNNNNAYIPPTTTSSTTTTASAASTTTTATLVVTATRQRLQSEYQSWTHELTQIRRLLSDSQWNSVAACICLGFILGYAIGAGWTELQGDAVSPWRQVVGHAIRSNLIFRLVTEPPGSAEISLIRQLAQWKMQLVALSSHWFRQAGGDITWWPTGLSAASRYGFLEQNPSLPLLFALLREAVVREPGGYVHPDLGFLLPAPSGAARGIGMVRNTFSQCQTMCFPGTVGEKQTELKKRIDKANRKILQAQPHQPDKSSSTSTTNNNKPTMPRQRPTVVTKDNAKQQQQSSTTTTTDTSSSIFPPQDVGLKNLKPHRYHQEEILLQIPLSFQMTRRVALETLEPLLPTIDLVDHLRSLDDAPLLTLLLALERMRATQSRWLTYMVTLPMTPSCGYARENRQTMLNALEAMRVEWQLDVEGWPNELVKASMYADRMVESLNRTFGRYLGPPPGSPYAAAQASLDGARRFYTHELAVPLGSTTEVLRWALCHVASRAVAGNATHGSLRLVPLLDLVNHDANAGRFAELTGTEQVHRGDYVHPPRKRRFLFENHTAHYPHLQQKKKQNNATTNNNNNNSKSRKGTSSGSRLYLVEEDVQSGTLVVKSRRHGERRALRVGQELLANYNIPHYSPLDWFVSMGFVPPERWGPWQLASPVLGRLRRDGPLAEAQQQWKRDDENTRFLGVLNRGSSTGSTTTSTNSKTVLSNQQRWERDADAVHKKVQETEKEWQKIVGR